MCHLSLHVPFCARRCSYCDFSIAVRKRVPAEEYVVLSQGELELVRAADPGPTARGLIGNDTGPLLFDPRGTLKDSLSVAAPGSADRGLETLCLGGGTPSLLPADGLATLLTILRDAFHGTPSLDAVEVTLEANPEDVTPDNAVAWRPAGVNRVSLGAQSFADGVLRWMHRS